MWRCCNVINMLLYVCACGWVSKSNSMQKITFVLVLTACKWLSPSFFFNASYGSLLSKCSLSHAVWGANWLKPTGTDQLSKRSACPSSVRLWDMTALFLFYRSVLIETSFLLTRSDCQAAILPGHQTPAQSRPLVTTTTGQCMVWLRRKCHRVASFVRRSSQWDLLRSLTWDSTARWRTVQINTSGELYPQM